MPGRRRSGRRFRLCPPHPRGELSIAAEKFDIIGKSLQPLPEKFHGLTDIEARYRQRYVDFIMNDDSREIFKTLPDHFGHPPLF